MKTLKYLAIGFAALVIFLAGALGVVAMNFDAARVKAELSKAVLETNQRTLRIDGDLSLSFWSSIGVNIGALSLSEPHSDKPFAAMKAARVAVQTMPLLRKQIVVDQIELSGVNATLVRHRDGTLNIADLLPKAAEGGAQPGKQSAGGSGSAASFDIAGIRLSDVRLTWHDEGSGQNWTLSALNLTTGRIANAARGKLDLSASIAGGPAGAATIQVAADYDYDIEKQRYDLAKLAAKVADAQRGLAVGLDLAGVAAGPKRLNAAKLELSLEAKAGDAALQGKLESPLSADLSAQTLELPKFSGELGITGPQLPMKQVKLPLSGKLRVDLAKQSGEASITTQFDETRLAAKVSVAKFAPLALGFDLDIDKLNLDRYLPPKPAKAAQPAGEKPQATDAAAARLDLGALRNLNILGTAKVGALQAAGIKVANLRLAVKAAGGQLDIAPHTANLYEGTLSGAFSVNANGNRVVAKEDLSGISINPLMKDGLGKDLLEGRGNVTLNITAQGDTLAAMKRALAGSASLSLKDGAIKGINLAQSFREAKAKISGKQDAVQSAKATDKTDFAELSASFKIANGVASNSDLSLKSPFLRLAGAGDIDIGEGAMNYLAKASVVNTSGGQGAKDLDALQGLTVPVRVTGPFDNLTYRLEFASLVQEALKAKVTEKRQEIQQKAQGVLTEKLKGLFGR